MPAGPIPAKKLSWWTCRICHRLRVYTDFEESDGKLLVQFESYSCGEADYDTYLLPLEFLFDEGYPEKYKVIFEEETCKKQEEKIRREEEKQSIKFKQTDEHDKREYERLKVKFGGG